MNFTPHALRLTSVLAAALLASACGGGGGSPGVTTGSPAKPANPTPPAAPANPAPTDPASPSTIPMPTIGCKMQVVADAGVVEGKTASASVLSCGASFKDVVWSQVSGPSVELLARRSPTVAFEAPAAGTVSLRADVTLADGSTTSATATLPVAARPAGSFITVRADHAVRPGADTSVRAWPTLVGGDTVTGIVWTQTAGQPVTMNTEDPNVLMFEAPTGADRALRFRATLTTSSGKTDSDEVTISLDRETPATGDSIFESAARVHPYRQASRYAPVLVRCAYDTALYFKDNGENNLCSTGTLPILQAEAGAGAIPSVEQVMGRVLVSHDFLGANFEQFLTTQDPHGDFRRLFAGATAIVIGSHVRPSFYTAATGAIYLDANYLWLTPAQRDVVTEVPDYRSSFDDALNFTVVGRLIRNGTYARRFVGDTDRVSRSGDELVLELGRLLYHELAHASDFMPPQRRSLQSSLSLWANVAPLITRRELPSDVLAGTYPLTSEAMRGLGQVMYLGATPSAEQRAYTAEQVGAFFAADVASDDYAYSINGTSSSREDLAMLFEEFMMSYRHGVRYDFGYTNKIMDGMNSDQLILGWGQRGRIADPAIKPRIKLVLEQIAPWIGASAVDTLPAPIQLQSGVTWDQSLTLAAQGSMSLSGRSAARIESASARQARRRDAVRRPHHAH